MAKGGSFYNGYSWPERIELLVAYKSLIAAGELAPATGPCDLCGDPDSKVEPHSEDYSKPYRWTPPAAYVLCPYCHRHQLHRRFGRPEYWTAFLAHVRRGGYASDLKNPTIRLEFETYRWALARGQTASLFPRSLYRLRPYTKVAGAEWFASLTMDPKSLRDPAARPR